MTKKEQQQTYVSPVVKALKIKTRKIICVSERQSMLNSTEMEAGDNNW